MKRAACLSLLILLSTGCATAQPPDSRDPRACADRYGIQDFRWAHFDRFLEDIQNETAASALSCMSPEDRSTAVMAWGETLLAAKRPQARHAYLNYLAESAEIAHEAGVRLASPACRGRIRLILLSVEMAAVSHRAGPTQPDDGPCLLAFDQLAGHLSLAFHVLRRGGRTNVLSGREAGLDAIAPSLAASTAAYVAEFATLEDARGSEDGRLLLLMASAAAELPAIATHFRPLIDQAQRQEGYVFVRDFGSAGAVETFIASCTIRGPVTDQRCKDMSAADSAMAGLAAQLHLRYALTKLGIAIGAAEPDLLRLDLPRSLARLGGPGSHRVKLEIAVYTGLLLQAFDKLGVHRSNHRSYLAEFQALGGFGARLNDPSDALDAIDAFVAVSSAIIKAEPDDEPTANLRARETAALAEALRSYLTTAEP